MIIKKKSAAVKFLEKISGGELSFGKMIHSIRLCDGISQAKLAEMVGVSRSYLCDIENERRFISLEKAREFAKVLGYSETQFVSTLMEDQLRHAGMPYLVELRLAA
jgi:transcriptional regulator with XRE-family HTH domain